jgi:hypothetical protein
MGKTVKLMVIVAALLGGLISGVCAHRALSGRIVSERETLPLIATLGEDVYRQYHSGDDAVAKAALLAHIRLLERADAESNRRNNNPYASDVVISYVRLAKLEEKNKGGGKAVYMREAMVRCERLRFKLSGCSAEALRRSVDGMDSITLR